MTSSEDDLIRLSQAGDLDSFNQLVDRYQGQVYNLVLRMLGNPQDAEDTTQEAFILAWKAIHRFRGGSFKSWLLRIASNASIDLLRSKKGRKTDSLDSLYSEYNPLPSTSESPEEHTLREELSHLITRNLLSLPDEQRLAITLADLQGLSYEEIAQVTKCSIGTVRSRLSRGRANLRNLLLNQRELLPPEFRL